MAGLVDLTGFLHAELVVKQAADGSFAIGIEGRLLVDMSEG